jgi:hypothetical protein
MEVERIDPITRLYKWDADVIWQPSEAWTIADLWAIRLGIGVDYCRKRYVDPLVAYDAAPWGYGMELADTIDS